MKLFFFENDEKDLRLLVIAKDRTGVKECLSQQEPEILQSLFGGSEWRHAETLMSELDFSDSHLFILAQVCPGCGDGWVPFHVSQDIVNVIPPCGEASHVKILRVQ